MFSFFSRNKDKPEVPEWASFFSQNEYSEFLKAIKNYFDKKNIAFELGDGVLNITSDDFGGKHLGLSNVSQVCKQNQLSDYKEIVAEHFNALERAQKFNAEFDKIVHDYNKVKKYIGVRLYHNTYMANLGKDITVGMDFAGDIFAMLVFDLPDSVININPEQMEKWNISFDEVFKVGLRNIKNAYPLDISEQTLGDFNIWFVQGDHFFTANIVFDLENDKRLIGTHGSLVAVPHRHSAIIYPIENMDVIKAINGLMPTVYGMNQEGPGSVSNNIFWYNKGQFENLPYKIENDKIQFSPPAKFVELLNVLA